MDPRTKLYNQMLLFPVTWRYIFDPKISPPVQIRSSYNPSPLNKKAAILQKTFSSMKTMYLIQISPKFVLKGPIDNKPGYWFW